MELGHGNKSQEFTDFTSRVPKKEPSEVEKVSKLPETATSLRQLFSQQWRRVESLTSLEIVRNQGTQ
jgi:hypothetical protein